MKTAEIRAFNQYYARLLGVFDARALGTEYSLPQARVIGEIARHPGVSANQIASFLAMDRSYLSRMISRLSREGMLEVRPAAASRRSKCLYLTAAGIRQAQLLDQRSDERIRLQLNALNEKQIQQLIGHMQAIEEILAPVLSADYPAKRGCQK